jgi:aspartate racemase
VLGTRYLMEGPVYPKKMKAAGLDHLIPDKEDRETINRIIFNELVYGRFEASAGSTFVTIIKKLKEQGCDAVALSCTEIPLLIGDADSPLPTLDSTRILARAALRAATT